MKIQEEGYVRKVMGQQKASEKLARFRSATRAYHVLETADGWEVKRIGGHARRFSEKGAALSAAKKAAAAKKVHVLVHESGNVAEAF